MNTEQILGYPVFAESTSDCIAWIQEALVAEKGRCRWFACLNPHSYVVAKSDPAFADALLSADWLVPDGIGIVIGAWFLGRPLQGRITGFDVFSGVMDALDARGGSVFFLGSTQDTLEAIALKMPQDYPNVRLAGVYSPPFKPEFDEADLIKMIDAISLSEADVLWVGMTAPKQEKWIAQHSGQLPVKFVGAIGAVFDFYAGKVVRSHPIFQKSGLEWLPRLLQQPRRLWRRMGISAPIFLWDVFRARFSLRTHEVPRNAK